MAPMALAYSSCEVSDLRESAFCERGFTWSRGPPLRNRPVVREALKTFEFDSRPAEKEREPPISFHARQP